MVDTRLRELVALIQNGSGVEVIEDVHDAPTVPIISDSTTIVDVACCVL